MPNVAAPLDLLAELTAGRYRIEGEIGRGGMGIVFLARDLSLDRPVAIKLLPESLATDPVPRSRFLLEARTAAQLSHPHIVPVHAVEEHDATVFYVMGLVDGETLTSRMRRIGPLPAADVVRLLQQVAWALAYAHHRGVVHRDIKPDNILLEHGSGHAWVLDFGIARVERPGVAPPGSPLTEVGMTVGTPEYMSPEQATGDAIDGRSDLYSLGVVAFKALTGQVPLQASSARTLLARRLTEDAPALSSLCPGLDPSVASLVDSLLAREPAARPATGDAVVEALARLQQRPSEIAPPVRAFVREAQQETTGLLRAVWVAVLVGAIVPASIVVMATVLAALSAGVFGRVAARARRLAQLGYEWADLQSGVRSCARESADEGLEFRFNEARTVLRGVALRAAGWLLGGMVTFGGVVVAARALRRSPGALASAGGLVLIVIGGVLMALSTIPLAYFAALRSGARSRGSGEGRLPVSLFMIVSPVGRLAFRMGARGVGPPPPQSVRGHLERLLRDAERAPMAASVHPSIGARRRAVRELLAREDALRTTLASLVRAEREAGEGSAAPVLRAERTTVQHEISEVVHLLDEHRQQLLLIGAGVGPVALG